MNLKAATKSSFGLLIFGGMAFGGSLGMHDIHMLRCNDKNAANEKLLFEWKEMIPTCAMAKTDAPPNDLKGHSITYIGNKLIILGGDRRSAAQGDLQNGNSGDNNNVESKCACCSWL